MRRTTSALTTAVLGGVLTASFVWARQPDPDDDSARSSAAASQSPSSEIGSESDPLSGIPVHRGARYLMRNGLDYLKYQQYDRALGFLREAESRQKELNEPEKRLLKQGIERARQGLRMASNAESPYALSEQSRHRNGFVPARSDSRPTTDNVRTASAAPTVARTQRRPLRSKSADLDLNRADAEEPIRLTSNEVVADAATSPADTTQDRSPDANRRGNLPQIPKFSAVPAWSEVPTSVAQQTPAPTTQPGTTQVRAEEPAPLALAMARPPANLPAASLPGADSGPAPAPSPTMPGQPGPRPTESNSALADVAPPPAALAAPIPAPDQRAGSEQPLLLLDAETPAPAPATRPSGPAPALSLADATAVRVTEPTPSTAPVVVAAPSASPASSSTLGATSPKSDGLALSTPPASADAPATMPSSPAASPALTTTETPVAHVEPSPSAPAAVPSTTPLQGSGPLVTTPPVVSIPATNERVTDSGAMRVANPEPTVADAPSVDSLPTLPDDLGRAPQSTALLPGLDRAEVSTTPAAAETLPPLDNALPPLPVDLGSPTRTGSDTAMPAASLSPALETDRTGSSAAAVNPSLPAAPSLENSESAALAAPTPIEVTPQPVAAPAPSVSAAESEPAKPSATAEATPPPIATEPTTAPLSAPAAPESLAAPSQPPPVTSSTAIEATAAAPAEMPNSKTADTPRQPGDPYLPERRPEVSNLQPRLRREVEEIAKRMENDLQNQPGGAAAPPAAVRDTSPTDLKTQFQLDISRAPSPAEARPIKAIPVPEDWVPLGPRNWAPQRKYWAAAATCHLPLYFQDPMLERYGHNVEQFAGPIARYLSYPVDDPRQSIQNNQVIQPFFSAGLMALQIVALPYNIVMDPPWEPQYDLGYYRPGDLIPTDTYWLPLHGYGPPLRGNNY